MTKSQCEHYNYDTVGNIKMLYRTIIPSCYIPCSHADRQVRKNWL